MAHRGAPYASPNSHPGTFAPGTKVQVGQHRVVVDRYLSEGGFAHVYVVRIPQDKDKDELAVLKRVAVPDKDALTSMRIEVDTMKKLRGHSRIVTYIDSHANQLKGGGFEVFLLMEFCAGGGLIDFMNTRLQHRLTEPEILHIIDDVAQGTACMHYLRPPLLHRDLKVENVLISKSGSGSGSGSGKVYKLCDFGSTAQPRPAARNHAEGVLIEDDVQRHTTMQYRSPEMVDVWRKQPIDEKSDIWALGVLLYKLCYYTTPFEEQGNIAILNASYKFPSYPAFSDKLKGLISSMLQENPTQRPNIYQVCQALASVRGTTCPIKDIYSGKTQAEPANYEQSPSASEANPHVIGLQMVSPAPVQHAAVPEITPMRRGRPKTQAHPSANLSVPPPTAASADPFAALDSKDYRTRAQAVSHLASKFPSIDEFSLLHNDSANSHFQFHSLSLDESATVAPSTSKTIQKKVTEVLADQAFALPRSTRSEAVGSRDVLLSRPVPLPPSTLDRSMQTVAPSQLAIHEAVPAKPMMVSTGIQTSPMSSPVLRPRDVSQGAIWRVSASKNAIKNYHENVDVGNSPPAEDPPHLELPPRPGGKTSKPKFLDRSRTKSNNTLTHAKSIGSCRPSLEGPGHAMEDEYSIVRAKSATLSSNPNSKRRPSSAYVESNLAYLRQKEGSHNKPSNCSLVKPVGVKQKVGVSQDDNLSDEHGPEERTTSDLGFLRSIESSEEMKRKRKSRQASSSGKPSRKSISSISLSGTKNILTGRFGDAFRRFEAGTNMQQAEQRTNEEEMLNPNGSLSPIVGSQATGTSRRSDEFAEDSLTPEVRREMERRRLSQEERRVAAAAAEYKQRLQQGRPAEPGPTKASTIQSRVRTLLDDSKNAPPTRTAEGYGKYTDGNKMDDEQEYRPVSRKGAMASSDTISLDRLDAPKTRDFSQVRTPSPCLGSSHSCATLRVGQRPSVVPKPAGFRGQASGHGLEKTVNATSDELDDWQKNFQKRYPSLSGIEMVETEIGAGSCSGIRDV